MNRLITAKIMIVRHTTLPFVVLVIAVDIVGLVIDVVNIFCVAVESLLCVGTVLVLPVECTMSVTRPVPLVEFSIHPEHFTPGFN